MSRTPVTPTTFPPKGAVRNRNDADMPPSGGESLTTELARIAREYGRWITVQQIAIEESCSVDTARRHILAGSYGRPIDRQPSGGLRLLTATYLATRRARLINPA